MIQGKNTRLSPTPAINVRSLLLVQMLLKNVSIVFNCFVFHFSLFLLKEKGLQLCKAFEEQTYLSELF